MTNDWIEKLGLLSAVVLPFWNIPLIVRIIKRKSSQDISLYWVLGVWGCIILMAPSGFQSKDFVWKTYNMINLFSFTAVVIVALFYRKRV